VFTVAPNAVHLFDAQSGMRIADTPDALSAAA
jgi:hypothetical protein